MRKLKFFLLLSMVFCLIIILTSCSKIYKSTNADEYQSFVDDVYNANLHMPEPSDLGDYESFFASRKTPQDMFFNTVDSVALIVQYNEDTFQNAYNVLFEKYDFVESKSEYVRDIEAKVNNFEFRIVDDPSFYLRNLEGERILSGHMLLLIGIDDVDLRIAYLYHFDSEGGVVKDLEEYIEKGYVLK